MAISGVGTKFRRWSGSAWAQLAEVNNISGPGLVRDLIETTHLGTTGGYKTFIAGFRDGGDVSFDMNFSRDDYDLMIADFQSDDLQDYEIVMDDSEKTSIEFSGFVMNMPLSIQPADKITVSVTIKVSGAISIDSGSGS